MTRFGWITTAFLLGLVLGAGTVQSFHGFRPSTSAEVFSRRLRCKDLANQYATKEESDNSQSVIPKSVSLEIVEYSSASNSCLAYFQTWDQFSRQISSKVLTRGWKIVDLLSNEVLYSEECHLEGDCGSGNNFTLTRRSEFAFHQLVNGKQVDVSKVK